MTKTANQPRVALGIKDCEHVLSGTLTCKRQPLFTCGHKPLPIREFLQEWVREPGSVPHSSGTQISALRLAATAISRYSPVNQSRYSPASSSKKRAMGPRRLSPSSSLKWRKGSVSFFFSAR